MQRTTPPLSFAQEAAHTAEKALKASTAHRGSKIQSTHVDDTWLTASCAADHYRIVRVYFIAENCGPVKIGHAERPLQRLSTLQVGNARRLFLISYVEAPREIERRLHHRLRDHLISGEWYAPEAEVFAAIESCERVFGDAHRNDCQTCVRTRAVQAAGRDPALVPDEPHSCGWFGRVAA